jgi:hypothetical protein
MNHTKRCTKCQGEFPATLEFFHKCSSRKDGLFSWCKNCSLEQKRKYYNANKTEIRDKNKKWYDKNRDKVLEQKKEYESRPEIIRQRRKTKNKYYHNKLKYDAGHKVRINLSRRIIDYINKSGSSVLDFIGCSIDDLKIHLEKQFVDGMSWENYGRYGWHVDHIRPCCSFDLTDPEQQRECFHYTNLQPLWAKDNLSKGGRYEFPHSDG